MFVGHFQGDLLYFGKDFQDAVAHGVEGVLNGEAFVRGEGVQEVFSYCCVYVVGI